MKLRNLYSVLGTTALCLLTGSCIFEDLSDCPQPELQKLSVMFTPYSTEYEIPDGDATLYIFNSEGYCVRHHTIVNPVYEETYPLSFTLPAGNYDMVTWINHHNKHFTNEAFIQEDTILTNIHRNDISISLNVPESGAIGSYMPSLMHGNTESFNLDYNPHTLSVCLKHNTNKLNITVVGLPINTDNYEIKIADKGGNYTFNNTHVLEEELHYSTILQPTNSNNEYTLQGQITMLRLEDQRTPLMEIRRKSDNKCLWPADESVENNIINLIRKAYQEVGDIDFAAKRHIDIRLEFDTNLNATVSIDGWVVNDQNDDLIPIRKEK